MYVHLRVLARRWTPSSEVCPPPPKSAFCPVLQEVSSVSCHVQTWYSQTKQRRSHPFPLSPGAAVTRRRAGAGSCAVFLSGRAVAAGSLIASRSPVAALPHMGCSVMRNSLSSVAGLDGLNLAFSVCTPSGIGPKVDPLFYRKFPRFPVGHVRSVYSRTKVNLFTLFT